MSLKSLSFTKKLIAFGALGAAGLHSWPLVVLCVAYLAVEVAKDWRADTTSTALDIANNAKVDCEQLRVDLAKVQEHLKNLQMAKLHRS